MGMEIDECIAILSYPTYYFPSVREKALDIAIDTMHKYQKIVQIMERTVDDGTSMYDTLQEIEEVIEDGQTSN